MSALAKELAGIDLGDLRLNRRARRVLQTLDEKPMLSIPSACGDWDETHAAYRLFDHAEVSAEKVLATHRARTVERIGAHPRVLCLEDTSAFDYTGKGAIQGLGPLNDGTRRGLYPHPTLAVTPDRLALGLLHAHSWSREPGSLAQSRDASRPPENKESVRWINGYQRINELAEQLPDTRLTYIADPEGDIHDLFIKASCPESCADRLVRGKHDRVLGNGETLRQRLTKAPVLTETSVEQPATNGRAARTVHKQIRVARVTLPALYRRDRKLADVEIAAIFATEAQPPAGEDPVEWLLLTNLAAETPEQALEKLSWYLCRWQIEIFFRILQSGCRIEELQLEKLDRLEPALAFYMIIAWRVLFLTMLGRECPEMPRDVVFDQAEWQAVYLVTQRKPPPGHTTIVGSDGAHGRRPRRLPQPQGATVFRDPRRSGSDYSGPQIFFACPGRTRKCEGASCG